MSKKIVALLMATLMLLSLAAACGNQPAETPDTPDTPATTPDTPDTPATTPDTPAEPVDPDAEKYGGDMIFVDNQVSGTIDPHNSKRGYNNAIWMQNVYETAVARGADGRIYPLICDYTESADGLTITLTVREYYYHNGDKVAIEDILASYERAALMYGSFQETYWSHVIDKKIDGDTLTLTLDKLVVDFMWQLSDPYGPIYILPKEICDKFGAEVITDQTVLDGAGTGPYLLDEYEPDTGVTVKRNENYVPTVIEGATGLAAPRMGYADTLTFAVNKDAASKTAGLIAGDYHAGAVLDQMAPYAEQVGLKRVNQYNEWTHAIFFNLHESNADSPVADVNFRKAFRAALDMQAIALSIYSGDATAFYLGCSPITPNNTDYYNDIIETTEWNIADKELAKEYLAKTDYAGEEIVWLVSSGSKYYNAAMAAIPMLEEVGINVKLQVVDSGSHGGLRGDPANGHDIGAWETQKAIVNPIGSTTLVTGANAGWWTHEKKTELLNIMSSTPNGSDASVQAYKDFCTLVADEVPWIGFSTTISKTYTQPNLVLGYEGIYTYHWNDYFID